MLSMFAAEVILLLWPALLVFVVLSVLVIPDRFRAGYDWLHTLLGCMVVLTVLWVYPVVYAVDKLFPTEAEFGFIERAFHAYAIAGARLSLLSSPMALAFLAAYATAGLVWAVVHFWMYARRLGQEYVFERDLWLRDNQLETLANLTSEQRQSFEGVVLAKVRNNMLYDGAFPLRPLQQKRFFAANFILWPVTLLAYFVGDLAMDVARQVWFAVRGRIRRYWERNMAEYLEDEAICVAYAAELAQMAAHKKDKSMVRSIIDSVTPDWLPGSSRH